MGAFELSTVEERTGIRTLLVMDDVSDPRSACGRGYMVAFGSRSPTRPSLSPSLPPGFAVARVFVQTKRPVLLRVLEGGAPPCTLVVDEHERLHRVVPNSPAFGNAALSDDDHAVARDATVKLPHRHTTSLLPLLEYGHMRLLDLGAPQRNDPGEDHVAGVFRELGGKAGDTLGPRVTRGI